MGSDGEKKSRYELLWESMSVASRGALDAVDKDVQLQWPLFSEIYFLKCERLI
jgi:hypothetical protein